LLVDDNVDDSALALFVLSRELKDAQIVRAADEDALERALLEESFDLAVTEYRLGWADGFHVLRTLRRFLCECPVVMFTGCGGEEIARNALKGGFADYVGKSPRGYLRLAQRVEACLGSVPTQPGPGKKAPGPEIPDSAPSSTSQSVELLQAVSHDLQEPLRGISRFSRLLEERLAEADPDTKRYLRHVVDASGRMREMLDDYLKFLRAGKGKDAGEITDLRAAVDSAMANLRAGIEESGAEITISRLPVVAAGLNDMVRLFQNLLENALKFRSAAPPRVEITAECVDSVHLLSVKDNGIGIDRADFHRVFQMHRRLHPTRDFPGNGMGLAICKRIVEEYGGRIWVDSQVGIGSTFYVTLPAVADSVSEETRESA